MDRFRRFGRRRDSHEAVGVGDTSSGGNYQVGPTSASAPSIEGFICPSCHSSFVAMDDLISHAPLCTGTPNGNFDGLAAVSSNGSSKSSVSDNDELMLKVHGYDAMKEGNDLLRQELQASHKQQQSLNETLERISIENDGLRKKISEQERVVSNMKASVDDKQFEHLAAERSANIATLESRQKQIDRLQDQVKSLETTLAQKETAMKAQQSASQLEISSLKSSLVAKAEAEKSLARKADSGKATEESLTAEINQVKSELKQERTAVNTLKTASDDLEMQKNSLQSALDRKEVELQKRMGEIAALAQEKLTMTSSTSDTAEKLRELDEKLKTEIAKKNEAMELLAQAKQSLEAKSLALTALEKDSAVMISQNQKLEKDLAEERAKMLQQAEVVVSLRTQLQNLEDEKSNLAENVTTVMARLENETVESTKLKQQLSEMTSKIQGDEASSLLISQLREDKEALEKSRLEQTARHEEQLRIEREGRDQAAKLITEFQTENSKLEAELEQVKRSSSLAEEEAKSAIGKLQESLVVVNERLKETVTEKEGLSSQFVLIESERNSLKEELVRRVAQKGELAARVKDLETSKLDLEQKLIGSEMESKEIAGQVARLLTEKEVLQQGKSDLRLQIVDLQNQGENFSSRLQLAEDKIQELTKEKDDLQARISVEQNSKNDILSQLEERELKIIELEEIVSSNQSSLTQLTSNSAVLEEEKQNIQSKLKAAEDSLGIAKQELQSQLKESEERIERERQIVQKVQTEKLTVEESLRQLTVERDTLLERLASTSSSSEAAMKKYFADLKTKEEELDNIRQEAKRSGEEKDVELSTKSAELATALKKENDLTSQLTSAREQASLSQKGLDEIQIQLAREMDQKGTLQDGLIKLQDAKDAAEQRADDLSKKLSEQTDNLTSLQEDQKRTSLQFSEAENRIALLTTEKADLDSAFREVRLQLEQKVEELRKSSEEYRSKSEEEDRKLADSEKEIKLLKSQTDKLSSELAESKSEVERKSGILVKLEKQKAELDKRLAEFEKKLSASLEEKRKSEEESAALLSKFQTRIADIENGRETAERSLHQLQQEKNTVASKIEKLEEEKRIALNRVIELDDKIEKSQASAGEMRRKYEDSLAALHELGREHQSLQVECSRLKSRKWAGDDEVADCSACGKAFGLTARKHHCRCCGEIFCQECSSKTASLVASKKPVRVCDSCYVEIQGRN